MSESIEVTGSQLPSALKKYDEAFLECRDLRHAWDAQRAGYSRRGNEVHRRLTCVRCETVRVDEWSTSGERLGSRYEHPDGYVFKGVGIAGVDARMVRKEMMRRVKIDSEPRSQRLRAVS